ncbi:radical SAM protein [Candidatus Syntrophocurvum alkaliphilum]|nr:radical SAM protein [Candidatus Syntrophocurvum alkaliphilum]
MWRAEPNGLFAYLVQEGKRIFLGSSSLQELTAWLETSRPSPLIDKLYEDGFIQNPTSKLEISELKSILNEVNQVKSPLRSRTAPELINLELTTRCPLRCPQCYCDLYKGKDLNPDIAEKVIYEAARLKVPYLNLSGGETLVYPHLDRLLKLINELGLSSAIAISGWGFDEKRLKELKDAGVKEIYVSLNGSVEEVNSLSRDGYSQAIAALELLQKDGEIITFINWVARNDNIADFPNLVKLAKTFNVDGIAILESKPDANMQAQAPLNNNQLLDLAEHIKSHQRKEKSPLIIVESCFSPLRAILGKTFFMNKNIGISKGCAAGRAGVALDVDGNWIPCRHLLKPESYPSLHEYWWKSTVLNQLRQHEENKDSKCLTCQFEQNCLPCRVLGDNYSCAFNHNGDGSALIEQGDVN